MFFDNKDRTKQTSGRETDEVKDDRASDVTPSEKAAIIQTSEKPVVVKTRRKHRLGLFTLLLLLLVGLALIAGFLLSGWATEKAGAPAPKAKIPVQNNPARNKPATDITALLQEISDNLQGGPVTHERQAPDYIVLGYQFAAVGDKNDSSGITIARQDIAVDVTMTKLENNLIEKGFKKSIHQVAEPYYGLVKYENTDTICGVSNNRPDSDSSQMKEVYLTCAPTASYTETAKVQKPFYDAYRAAHPDRTTQGLAYPRIIESRTKGYKIAEAGIYSESQPAGAMGLFYQTPDQKWRFFAGTQQALPCSDYSTPDLKKAYLGESCMGEDSSGLPATVQL